MGRLVGMSFNFYTKGWEASIYREEPSYEGNILLYWTNSGGVFYDTADEVIEICRKWCLKHGFTLVNIHYNRIASERYAKIPTTEITSERYAKLPTTEITPGEK